MTSIRNELFRQYKRTHADFVDDDYIDFQKRYEWFRDLYRCNYAKYINCPDAIVLEIGRNKEYFLKVLKDMGFKHCRNEANSYYN